MTVVASESFAAIYDELLPLFRLHWRDLGPYKDRMPLSPNLQIYQFLESVGQLLCLTARQDRKLIGYLIAKTGPGLHYASTNQAITDIPYVRPDVPTRGLVMMRLFHAAEQEFRKRGVGPWFASYKVGSQHAASMDRLLRIVGMTPCDLQFSKWLD